MIVIILNDIQTIKPDTSTTKQSHVIWFRVSKHYRRNHSSMQSGELSLASSTCLIEAAVPGATSVSFHFLAPTFGSAKCRADGGLD